MLSCDINWLYIVFSVRLTNESPLMIGNSNAIKIDLVIYICVHKNVCVQGRSSTMEQW